jgi:hypothetical protein
MNRGRRTLLKHLGLGSAGITVAAGLYQGAAVLEEGGGEVAKEELLRLKKAYELLDARTKLIMKLLLTVTGIDLLSDLALIASDF